MTTDPELSITRINNADTESWQHIWKNCPWATFFESPEWSSVYVKTYGNAYALNPLEIEFSDGIIAVVPGVSGSRLHGIIHVLECSPGGNYGGPISINPLQIKHLELIVDKVRESYPNFNFRLNPYLLESMNVNKDLTNGDFTQKIDLSLPDDAFHKLFRKRRIFAYAAKAKEMGYVIKHAPANHLPELHRIYTDASKNWNNVAKLYPLTFLQKLAESPMCDFMGCYDPKDNLTGGGLLVRSKHHAISWFAIIGDDYKKKGIFDFFYYEVIFHYRKEGLKYFDFNPSGGNEGVVWYKDKFQPDHLAAPVLSESSSILKIMDSILNFGKRNA